MNNVIRTAVLLAAMSLAACAPVRPTNYGATEAFQAEKPVDVLVVPVVNNSVEVTAADYFLSTISKPVAERGFYVYPVNMVKRVMEDDGLADANMVHQADPVALASLFGADAVLYVTIENWTAQYAVLSTTVLVEFDYLLKSGATGETLWHQHEARSFSPQNNQSSGNPLADLVAAAVTAAITKAMPQYIPLAQQANAYAVNHQQDGLPYGPYHTIAKQAAAKANAAKSVATAPDATATKQ